MIEDPKVAPTTAPGELAARSVVDRAKGILTNPKVEWARIEAEPATVASLFTSYAMILAAIGPFASLIGYTMIGLPLGYAFASAISSYLIGLITVFVVALVIDAVAPTFGGTKDPVKATKLAVYAATPIWLAGIFAIIPQLLALLGLIALVAAAYGIYLLYLGLPGLMRVSKDRAIGFTAVAVLAWIILSVVLTRVVLGTLQSLFFTAPLVAPGAVY